MSRSYLVKLIEEMRKMMSQYEKQLSNVFNSLNIWKMKLKLQKANKRKN